MKERFQSKVLINMLSYFSLQIVNLLVGIVLPRLYLKTYGSEVNGVISTINSFISYFAYIEAGLGLSLIHALYKPLSDHDQGNINTILSSSQKQYHKISFYYLIGVVFLSGLFPMFNGTSALPNGEFSLLIFVIGLYGALDFFSMAKYRVLLTADRREYVISCAMIVAQLLRFVFTWVVLRCNVSVAVAKIIPILTLLVRTVILKCYIKRNYPQLSYDASDQTLPVVTNNRWDVLLLQISVNTSVALPVLILTRVSGYRETSVFAVYNLVIGAVISLVSALSSGVAPMFGKKIAANEEITNLYCGYVWSVSFVLTLIFSACAILILPFITLYVDVVSDVQYIYVSYAILFSLWGALYTFRIPLTAIINAAALYKENRINNIVNLGIQFTAGIVGAHFWGINGLLVSMILTAVHRNVSMSVVVEKANIEKSIGSTLKYQFVLCAVILCCFLVGIRFISLDTVTVENWLLSAIVSAPAITVLCLVVFGLVDWRMTKSVLRQFLVRG